MRKGTLSRNIAKLIVVLMIVQVVCIFGAWTGEGEGEFVFVLGDTSTYPIIHAAKSETEYSTNYYNQLSEYAKTIYDTKLNNIDLMREGVEDKLYFDLPYEGITVDDISIIRLAFFTACFALDYDHPENFWVSKVMRLGYTFSTIDGVKVLKTVYHKKPDTGWWIDEYLTAKEVTDAVASFNDKIDEIVAEAGTTDYRKVRYFHDWLVENNRYNSYVADGQSDKASEVAWTAASALIGTEGVYDDPVCEGYARAFKTLCDASGVECAIVSGSTYKIDDNGDRIITGNHMWNEVNMFYRWFAVDVTFDDPVGGDESQIKSTYYLKGIETMSKKHVEDEQISENCRLTFPNLYNYDYRTAAGSYLGDATADNKLNTADAVAMLRHIVGAQELEGKALTRADFDCNKSISTADAVMMLRYLVAG